MFALKKMTKEMHDEVLAMVEQFYHSDAVCHPVPEERLEQTFADAVSDDPILEGFVLTEDGKTVGFAYITEYYACEVGGRCLMFEELYLKEETRGKGYGTRFFDEIMKAKPGCAASVWRLPAAMRRLCVSTSVWLHLPGL